MPSPIPPSRPAPYRHLGAGGPRPVRSQMIATLLALLVLVAVPLYLWRRPKPIETERADAGPAQLLDAAAADAAPPTQQDAGIGAGAKASFSEPKTIRCIPATGGRVSQERCDRLTAIENALVRSIRENVACAPQNPPAFTVSFVLWVDFNRRKTHLWAGRSGTLRKRAAADLIRCVERAMPEPDWDRIAHQYAKYDINVMVSYQGVAPPVVPIP